MWDLLCTMWQWYKFFSEWFSFPISVFSPASHSHWFVYYWHCITLAIDTAINNILKKKTTCIFLYHFQRIVTFLFKSSRSESVSWVLKSTTCIHGTFLLDIYDLYQCFVIFFASQILLLFKNGFPLTELRYRSLSVYEFQFIKPPFAWKFNLCAQVNICTCCRCTRWSYLLGLNSVVTRCIRDPSVAASDLLSYSL